VASVHDAGSFEPSFAVGKGVLRPGFMEDGQANLGNRALGLPMSCNWAHSVDGSKIHPAA